ncbi:MAG: Signal recognition particle receptor FtsY [candidate division TM6 bacterium GW2011_GWF2_38_10]|nr:MAG: Signal recognition particle receptor FtsY [candidate division TM6 bacterium GW2011_GWF2_38_10]
MFNFLKEKIKKIYTSFTTHISSIFSRNTLDEQFFKELNDLLIESDTGTITTNKIIEKLKNDTAQQKITTMEQAKQELENLLLNNLNNAQPASLTPKITLLVGINGSGKTTFGSKYAHLLQQSGKKVLLVAGDTFRAAATQQLAEWGSRIGVPVFIGKENQDPASVIFDACTTFKNEHFDHLIIDTAGRLQTKVNLMKELEKIRKIINRQLPNEEIHSWIVIDAMLGQNSLRQAELFHEATKLDGLILTKLDGTGKGGIIFAINEKLQLPIVYVTFGENVQDIKVFNAQEYVHHLLFE